MDRISFIYILSLITTATILFLEASTFRRRVENIHKEGGESWLLILNEMQQDKEQQRQKELEKEKERKKELRKSRKVNMKNIIQELDGEAILGNTPPDILSNYYSMDAITNSNNESSENLSLSSSDNNSITMSNSNSTTDTATTNTASDNTNNTNDITNSQSTPTTTNNNNGNSTTESNTLSPSTANTTTHTPSITETPSSLSKRRSRGASLLTTTLSSKQYDDMDESEM